MGDLDARLKVYELYLADVGRMGGRHETSRQFYVTVISAIFAFLALAGKDSLLTGHAIVVCLLASLVGIGVCTLWLMHMRSFAVLFSVKLRIVREVEAALPVRPFTEDEADETMRGRARLTQIDIRAAWIFMSFFVALGCVAMVFAAIGKG